MSGKVNRGLIAASILLSVTTGSVAHAMSDEVAVQLLERLGELEKEISGLRGENEVLRNELQGIRSTQRQGFLEVDERVSGLEDAKSSPGLGGSSSLGSTALSADSQGLQGQALLPQAPDNNPDTLPALEDPIVLPQQAVSPSIAPALTAAIPNSGASASTANPEDRKAIAPAVEFKPDNAVNAAAKIDKASPESYYFYGTDNNREKKATTPAAEPAKAVVRIEKTIPDKQKPKAAYNQAYKLLVNDPKLAVPAFQDFLQKYPQHELAANAQYWLGEALYAQKNYSGATEEFMKVLKQHKSSPKAPGAALKLGYSFYELRQWEFARRTLEDTIRFFPDSNAAGLAKNRLARMTTEGH